LLHSTRKESENDKCSRTMKKKWNRSVVWTVWLQLES
jgi:hypothetical protein